MEQSRPPRPASRPDWDVIVIGSGVLGTFQALFAGRHGLRTLLIERAMAREQVSALFP